MTEQQGEATYPGEICSDTRPAGQAVRYWLTLNQAYTPWRKLWIDLCLLAAGVLVMALSYALDSRATHPDWFHRSGSVAVLLSGLLAYRSLKKHYGKFFNDMQRGYALETSRNQSIVDYATLILSVVGTLVWGYGDVFM